MKFAVDSRRNAVFAEAGAQSAQIGSGLTSLCANADLITISSYPNSCNAAGSTR